MTMSQPGELEDTRGQSRPTSLRDARGLIWLEDIAQDVRHGLRSLRHNPLFTAVALVTLALGVGANTAMFSIVNGVVLQPLAYPEPEQLMHLTTRWSESGERSGLSAAEYFEFRRLNRAFAAVGVYSE